MRVVAAVEDGGLSIPEAARGFQVGLTCIQKMLTVHRAGESLEPRPGGGPVPLLQEQETTVLRRELKVRPAVTRDEWQQGLTAQGHTTASLSPLARGVQVRNRPRKKQSPRPGAGRQGPHEGSPPPP